MSHARSGVGPRTLDLVDARLRTRGLDPTKELAELATLECERRRLIPMVETLKRDQNTAGEAIARAKRTGRIRAESSPRTRPAPSKIRALEARARRHRDAARRAAARAAQSAARVRAGGDVGGRQRRGAAWGAPAAFSFTPKPHWELGPALGILDFDRATRMSGARFSVLLGAGARLARALINFMLELHTREHGYTEVEPPFLVNRAALTGTGNLPKFEQDLFKIAGDWDLFLIPTAEVPLTNLHREEILDGRQLPLKYTAYTPCFRSEAGSYGADVRGLIRQHQFDKVELVKFTTPEQSHDELERAHARTPRRCSSGSVCRTGACCCARATWDSRRQRRTTSRCGCRVRTPIARFLPAATPRRSRRGAREIRFRPDGSGKAQFAHTLNGSGLAVGRTLIAILENDQQADGSVVIPEALRPYMGMDVITTPRETR